MKFYGNIDLNDNEIQKLVFENELTFPVSAPVGTIVFKDKRLWMCVALNVADPIWIPISNTINTYSHIQPTPATTWNVTHNLDSVDLLVQVYDENHELMIVEEINILNSNQIYITLSAPGTGKAVILFGDEVPANGISIIA
jgi:hypothetical protein